MAKVYLKKSKRSKWGCYSDKGEKYYFKDGEGCVAQLGKYCCGDETGCIYIQVPAPEVGE